MTYIEALQIELEKNYSDVTPLQAFNGEVIANDATDSRATSKFDFWGLEVSVITFTLGTLGEIMDGVAVYHRAVNITGNDMDAYFYF